MSRLEIVFVALVAVGLVSGALSAWSFLAERRARRQTQRQQAQRQPRRW